MTEPLMWQDEKSYMERAESMKDMFDRAAKITERAGREQRIALLESEIQQLDKLLTDCETY